MKILLDIGIILIVTKLMGNVSRKMNMPEVLGALLSGIIIGPALLGLVHESEAIRILANLGVVMLMFSAGLETNMNEFKKAGFTSFMIAIGGIVIPLILGMTSAAIYSSDHYQNLFIGVILTATSVSITVETLKEMGKLNTKAGINILGAAIIDDILGLIMVSFVLGFANAAKSTGNTNVSQAIIGVFIHVTIFIVIAGIALLCVPRIIEKYQDNKGDKPLNIPMILAFAFLGAFLAEELGIAAITGAYVCGLVLSSMKHKEEAYEKVETISSNFLSPIFFASIGLGASFTGLTMHTFILIGIMLLTAVLGKIIGCAGMARLCKMSKKEAMQIGAGMVSRGEVALITTNLGLQSKIISEELFIPILIVVVATTIITPILLKITFAEKKQVIV